MSTRSLPHFTHDAIGKTTHQRGAAYNFVNYITRPEACSHIAGNNMPTDRSGARPYFDRQAYKDGVAENARVADTFIMALPIELSREQRHAVVEGFMSSITKDRIAWLAAFHDKGKDEHNPHCHLILRDADIETGRKVLGTTTGAKDVKEAQENGWRVPPRMTTKDLRDAWCRHLNGEMERFGYEARFDHRTLKDQGIDREAGIHVGPKANSMAQKGRSFDSQDRFRGNHANVYSLIDTGTRAEHNRRIAVENAERERNKASADAAKRTDRNAPEARERAALRERQSAERKAMYQEQTRDRAALREAHNAERLAHQRWGRSLYAEARKQAFEAVKAEGEARWKRIRQISDGKRRQTAIEAMKLRQKEQYKTRSDKLIAACRPVKDQAWVDQKAAQENARKDLQARHLQEAATLSRQHAAERLAVHGKFREADIQRQALNASTYTKQSMPQVQTKALMQLKVRTKIRGQLATVKAPVIDLRPASSAADYRRIADAEALKTRQFRLSLTAQRQSNQLRAADPARRSTQAGQIASARSQHRAEAGAQNRQRDLRRAVGSGEKTPAFAKRSASEWQARLRTRTRAQRSAEHTAAAIKQAAASGRTLSDAERANASAETKTTLSAHERKDRRERQFDRWVQRDNGGRDNGRSGGRSGR